MPTNDEIAAAEVNNFLMQQQPNTPAEKVELLDLFIEQTGNERAKELARHMVEYAQEELKDDRFGNFLRDKSQSLGIRITQMSVQQVQEARTEFDNLKVESNRGKSKSKSDSVRASRPAVSKSRSRKKRDD